MTRSKIFFLATLCTTSVLLAACNGPKVNDPDVKFSKQTNQGSGQNQMYNSQSDSGQTDGSNPDQMGSQTYKLQGNSQATPPQKGPASMPMKKLEDFEAIEAKTATIKTTQGDITFDLYADKAPITVRNFLNLAQSGFYDNIVFHRVIADFMAQVGDPKTKEPGQEAAWGTGGPGYVIPDEFSPDLKFDGPGVVAMANAGPNTGGSQIFITYEATPWLDGKHTIFGKVTAGMDVLNKIKQGDKILAVSYK